jgi:hypothetical protein
MRSLLRCVLIYALLCSAAAVAQQFAPAIRIIDRIDESNLVTLKGNTHPYANARNDLGRVKPELAMTDLILVLSRDSAQQATFDQFVASQYDSTSPNFHKWLTPEEVGSKFGPAETDIATVSNWLTGHGFTVNEMSKDRLTIRFSGAAGQVESAFHTEIHNLTVKGAAHIGNMSDPQIPAALSTTVVGVKALHNFFARPLHHLGSQVKFDSATGKWQRLVKAADSGSALSALATNSTEDAAAKSASVLPEFGITIGSGSSAYVVEDVAPYDFATIYNILPLWSADIDGNGQTIAIAGTSNINPTDVATFRSDFGLPANAPTVVIANGADPGVCTSNSTTASCTIDDLIENTLDVEWAGAVATGANIVLVTSGVNSTTTDALLASEQYIVNDKTASIMNVSYGECELFMGTAGNALYNSLWQSAASEGIAVFVASGDSSASGCDQGLDTTTPYGAKYGLAISGMASTPYNTAVGGTDLNWGSTASPYWSTTNNPTTKASALGYIPEVPWNDSCASSIGVQYLDNIAANYNISGVFSNESACNFAAQYSNLNWLVDIVGGGGGVSSCTVNDGATVSSCSGGYAKPSWQQYVPGIPADGKRDIPDVSFFASPGFLGSAYLICVSEEAACTYSTKSEPFAQEVGGTSVASPAMAGVMALINQQAGAEQGSPNTQLYALAAAMDGPSCISEDVNSGCDFQDIDSSDNAVPCLAGSANCSVLNASDAYGILSGYSATTGYNQATGLGSLNVAHVVNDWVASGGTATATISITPATTMLTTAQSLSVTVTLTGSRTLGTPTGHVVLQGPGYYSLARRLLNGSYTFIIPAGTLATGSDTLTVTYSGDSNYAPITGTTPANTTTVQVTALTPTVTVTPSATSIDSNIALTLTGSVTGSDPTPTGTVTFTGAGFEASQWLSSSGAYSFTIPANYFTASGNLTLTVTYNGDTVYLTASNSTTVSITYVPKLTPIVTVTPTSFSITTAQALSVTVAVNGGSGNPTPTGTVTLTGGDYSTAAVPLTSGNATLNIPADAMVTGSDILTASFSPDSASSSIYNSATGTSSAVTVTLQTNLVPVIGSISPAFTDASSVAFTLTVNGSGFTSQSAVYWGTTALTTTYVSATKLTAPVTAAEIASAGITPITVQTPTPGGETSNSFQFEVDSANSATTPPSFTVTTASVAAGSMASYSLTLPSTVESATVSCLNLPTGAACSYSSTSNALTITTSSTTPKGTYQVTVVFTETVTGAATSWILLPFLLLPLIFLRRKMAARSYWMTACLALVLLTAAAYTSGCGGGGTSTTTPPPQSHQVVSSGAVSLTVQQAANGNYAAAAATTSFTVNPETPTITWAAPAAITDTTNPSTTPTGSVTFTDTTTSPAPSGSSCYTLHPAMRCRVNVQDIIDLRFTLVQENILRELSD